MDVLVAVLAILTLSLFFVVRFKLNAAVAPFFSIALIAVWLCLTGMLNLLVPGVLAVYAFAVFGLVWVFALKKVPLKEVAAQFFTPGIGFFIAVSVAFYIALSLRDPRFIAWDEFSFWGLAAKVVFVQRQLYTFVETSMVISYPPMLSVLSFFVQFFGNAFSEWKTYFAYDILMMSAMAMLFARVKWKQVLTVLALCFFGVAVLYIFWWTFESRLLYCTTYGDIPIGVVFGGCVLSYFMAGNNKAMRWLVPLVGITALAFMKDIGMALGLIAAAVITVDILISKEHPFGKVFGSNKKWLRALIPLALFAAAVLAYLVWNLHFKLTVQLERTPEAYIYTPWEVLTGKDPYFFNVVRYMTDVLFVNQIVTFGTVFEMCIILTVIPIFVGIFTFDKKRLLRLTVFSLLMLGSFFVFYYFHAYLYTTVFTFDRNYELHGYGRYLSSHVAGWVIAVVGICFSELAKPKKPEWLGLKLATVIALLISLSNVYFLDVAPDQYVFTSSKLNVGLHGTRKEAQQLRDEYGDALRDDDRIYFICQGSSGGEFYFFNFDLYPCYVIQPYPPGDFVSMDTPQDALVGYEVRVDRALFVRDLRDNDADLVFILMMDQYFFDEMRLLFSDGLTGAADKSARLYLVVDRGGDDITMMPVHSEQHLEQMRLQYGV